MHDKRSTIKISRAESTANVIAVVPAARARPLASDARTEADFIRGLLPLSYVVVARRVQRRATHCEMCLRCVPRPMRNERECLAVVWGHGSGKERGQLSITGTCLTYISVRMVSLFSYHDFAWFAFLHSRTHAARRRFNMYISFWPAFFALSSRKKVKLTHRRHL